MKRFAQFLMGIAILVTLACGGGGGGGSGGGITQDTIPPTIGSLSVSPEPLAVGTDAQITATATDLDSGVEAVQATLTYPDNSTRGANLTRTTGNTYRANFTAQWNGTAGRLRIRLQAVDRAGNNATQEIEVRLIGNPPAPPF